MLLRKKKFYQIKCILGTWIVFLSVRVWRLVNARVGNKDLVSWLYSTEYNAVFAYNINEDCAAETKWTFFLHYNLWKKAPIIQTIENWIQNKEATDSTLTQLRSDGPRIWQEPSNTECLQEFVREQPGFLFLIYLKACTKYIKFGDRRQYFLPWFEAI